MPVLQVWVLVRKPEPVPLLLLVSNVVLFNEHTLRQVLQKSHFKGVKPVGCIPSDTLVSEVLVDLCSLFEGVAVLVAESVVVADLVLASLFDLLVEHLGIPRQVFRRASQR